MGNGLVDGSEVHVAAVDVEEPLLISLKAFFESFSFHFITSLKTSSCLHVEAHELVAWVAITQL